MGYLAIEAAALSLLQALSQFSDDDVTRGDFRVLDRGSAPYAVLYPGGFEVEDYGDWGEKLFRWTMYCEIFEKYLNDGTSYTDLQTTRQNVIDCFNANPSMNGTSGVIYVQAERGEDLIYLYDEGGEWPPQFIMQRVAVMVHEVANYDGSGEFA
jgi:hypothetical protein